MNDIKAIKVRIYPNKSQKVLIEKHFGCCRFIYNYALEQKIKSYNKESKKSKSKYDIINQITQLKKTKECEWLNEVYSQSLQQSVLDLDSAFTRFFKHQNQFPKFKSKKHPSRSYRIPKDLKLNRTQKYLRIPKVKWVKFKDEFKIPEDIKILNATVSRSGNEYYVSICYKILDYKEPEQKQIKEQTTIGIDLGIKDYAILSNGKKYQNHKFIKKYEDELAKQQKKLSKKQKDSNSYIKQKNIVNKVHKKIKNCRLDKINKLVKELVDNQNYEAFAIEDLSIQKMQQEGHHELAKLISDAGWYMFSTKLKYKSEECGKNVIKIGRFEPSSKLCTCGKINDELKLSDRTWVCKECGTEHDRDILAANNIKNFALKSLGKNFV